MITGPSITIGGPARQDHRFDSRSIIPRTRRLDPALDERWKSPARGEKIPSATWLEEHIKRAAANKEYYGMVLFTWAHRLAILLLPILAGLLALVYVRRRKQFFIYDHLIVAMQFLSFEFLVFAIAWIIPDPVRQWALS